MRNSSEKIPHIESQVMGQILDFLEKIRENNEAESVAAMRVYGGIANHLQNVLEGKSSKAEFEIMVAHLIRRENFCPENSKIFDALIRECCQEIDERRPNTSFQKKFTFVIQEVSDTVQEIIAFLKKI